MLKPKKILDLVVKALEDNKGIEITSLNVKSLTDMTEYMVICTAQSTRHAKTLADKVIKIMHEHKVKPYGVEGLEQSDWVLIDLNDVIVHIMLASLREFYSLEKLWTVTQSARQKACKSK